ncbi:Aldehyde dehydrogenase 3 [Lachnellula arida]|uniref:Aldehyde dehydrogenase n=1 Tax=Lachnellula arida TaxID=1316785 RepID=A0A8T9BP88_9HELO|nr:Aldehyde dehydrogenase 3 [Lachnellula arida]
MTQYTSAKEFESAYSALFSTFATGKTKDLKWRKWQLKQVWWMIIENEAEILDALSSDLNRHEFESHGADLLGLKTDTLEHIEHLEEWTADEIPDAGVIFGTLGKARVRKEPLGVALIIGAWNFPFLLLLQPMLAAIAAGCCVMLKPSELAEASQALLVSLIPRYLDPSAICIVTGGPAETGRILEHRFNHIFFTGSSKVARFITAAAAKHLTPLVLELGGQGPAIVTASADVDLAAKRIAYGKFMNAGQICLSINHVFADPVVYDELVERLSFWFAKFMDGSYDGYCKIINERNFDRLASLLDKTQGKLVCGGKRDRSTCFFDPTVVRDVTTSDSLLSEELFGPILPVIKANHVDAYKTIASEKAWNIHLLYTSSPRSNRSSTRVSVLRYYHPLILFVTELTLLVLANTNSGGVTINDVIMHAGVPNAPFGGVGDSGYGAYHGFHGFLCFTHQRVVVAPPTWLDMVMSFRYPPYDLKHLSKVAVAKKLGFQPGEQISDQIIHRGGKGSVWMKSMKLLAQVVICFALARLVLQRGTLINETKGLWQGVARKLQLS